MTEQLQPCPCGYAGQLVGDGKQQWLTCPQCQRTVEAFTLDGLARAWNRRVEGSSDEQA